METLITALVSVAGTITAAVIVFIAAVKKPVKIIEWVPEEHKDLSGEHRDLSGEHNKLSAEHRDINKFLTERFEKMCENDAGLYHEIGSIRTYLEIQEVRRQEADRQEQTRCGQLPSESQMMFYLKNIFINHGKLAEENASLKEETGRLRDEIIVLKEENARMKGKEA